MISVKLQDTKSIIRNQLHFYILIMKHLRKKFKNYPIQNSIKNKIHKHKFKKKINKKKKKKQKKNINLTEEVNDVYDENYNILLKKTGEDTKGKRFLVHGCNN